MTVLEAPAATGRVVRSRGGEISLRYRPRSIAVASILIVLTATLGVFSLSNGDMEIPFRDVIASLIGRGAPGTDFVVLELRLPRVLLAILVGAALAVSGGVFQSLTRNPLGSPDFIGLTVGSATGALIIILVVGGSTLAVSFGALSGCLITSAAVYLLAFRGGSHGVRLILVGVGVSAMLAAFNSFLITRARLEEAAGAQVWLIGTLNGRSWQQVVPVAVTLALCLPVVAMYGRRLGLLALGDDVATSTGVPVERTRTALLVAAVLLVAVATAAAGPIAFIALAAPQLAARLTRSPEVGIAAAAAMGAFLLTVSDVAAQRMLPDTPLPVGVLTGAIGGAYLTWLLVHQWRRGSSG